MRARNGGIAAVVVAGLLALTLVANAGRAQQAEQDKFNYLALIMRMEPPPTATPTTTLIPTSVQPTQKPTATPTLPPPSFNDCEADPNPGAAPNYPVQIVTINKVAETVTLRNVTTSDTIDLSNWRMCSILGGQYHPISGTLAPGESRTFPGPAENIWNNSSRDDGALYNPAGQLVSYRVDQ